jgi:hypothetical protein
MCLLSNSLSILLFFVTGKAFIAVLLILKF